MQPTAARLRWPLRRALQGARGQYLVPSLSIIRDVLMRVDPLQLDQALQRWTAQFASQDSTLALDGKTMCNATEPNGAQTHLMSVVGHESATVYAQKKSALCR